MNDYVDQNTVKSNIQVDSGDKLQKHSNLSKTLKPILSNRVYRGSTELETISY